MKFTYRTEFPWTALLASSAATLLITVLTVSIHTLSAANTKPAASLRTE